MASFPPWWSENRTSVRFIKEFQLQRGSKRWGYAVYRTVYTPESNARWEEAMDKLRALMLITFRRSQHLDPSLDPEPEHIIEERLDLHVQQDEQTLDGVDETTVRDQFRAWVQEHDDPELPARFSSVVCLVIDEESLTLILESPEATMENWDLIVGSESVKVKAVDGYWSESIAERGAYLGWSQVVATTLKTLYSDLKGLEPHEVFSKRRYEGQIPLYTGDPSGKLIDPPGGSFGRRKFGGTQRGPPSVENAPGGTQRGTQGGTQRGTQGGAQGGTQRGPPEGTQRGP
ncbi:hypothetical protein KVT40_002952 [Elsinoe batatas]|uniref:Uncharacterized protein n=1 Tax=Elsinoe batatas TaxID=2601811 RepID=A0A8K0PI14_9PEZI|nr:hypothetical protein KVT40_002952 [Elsinoe batatas]